MHVDYSSVFEGTLFVDVEEIYFARCVVIMTLYSAIDAAFVDLTLGPIREPRLRIVFPTLSFTKTMVARLRYGGSVMTELYLIYRCSSRSSHIAATNVQHREAHLRSSVSTQGHGADGVACR